MFLIFWIIASQDCSFLLQAFESPRVDLFENSRRRSWHGLYFDAIPSRPLAADWTSAARLCERRSCLQRDGFVDVNARRGTFVSRIDISDLTAIYEARARIESWATRLAAERMRAGTSGSRQADRSIESPVPALGPRRPARARPAHSPLHLSKRQEPLSLRHARRLPQSLTADPSRRNEVISGTLARTRQAWLPRRASPGQTAEHEDLHLHDVCRRSPCRPSENPYRLTPHLRQVVKASCGRIGSTTGIQP